MINKENLDRLRNELSVKAKNGIDFTLAASLVWLGIALVWTLDASAYNKSVLTFIGGGIMLPLAFGFSKIMKTIWTIKENPIQPLGLWLNFAQLFYFPFLVFALIRMPEYFVMVYAIITGAHFFPYSWFYNNLYYAIFAGIISLGSLILGLTLAQQQFFFIPLFLSLCLLVLTFFLYFDSRKKQSDQ
jgi:hypothetical protein